MKFSALALALVLVANSAEAESFETGNQLHGFCPSRSDGTDFGEGFSAGYITGVFDHADSDAAKERRFCRPRGIPVGQVRDVVCKWLAGHPEHRQLTADSLVVAALADTWPCPKP